VVKEHTPNLGVLNDDEDLEATAVKKDEKEVSLHGLDRKKPSIAEELEKDEQEVSSEIGRQPGQASHVDDPGNAEEKEDISYRTCATLRDLIFSNRVHREQSKVDSSTFITSCIGFDSAIHNTPTHAIQTIYSIFSSKCPPIDDYNNNSRPNIYLFYVT